jgi:hypothetical protein
MNAIALKQGCSLSSIDWRVVEIARMDGARSTNPDGRLARFCRNFFGLPIARKLANERLEALRRFSVRAWYWDLIRSADVRTFLGAGYSMLDAFQILTHVAGYRGFTPSIQEQAT